MIDEVQNIHDEVAEKPAPKKLNFKLEVFEWIESLIKAFVFIFILNIFVFRSVTVIGTSMVPTLGDGDVVIIHNFAYTPKRGDIVVIQADNFKNQQTGEMGEPIIKRVIGIGGDEITFDTKNGTVIRNGEVLDEQYISDKTYNSGSIKGTIIVPEGEILVLGDNRPVSRDSRDFNLGTVKEELVMGKFVIRLFPLDKIGGV